MRLFKRIAVGLMLVIVAIFAAMNPNGVEQSGLMTRKDGATELILRDADQNPVISFGACPTFPEAFHYLAAGIQTWQRSESGQPAFSILERHPAGLN